MKWLPAVLPFAVAVPLLIVTAYMQGKETERWGEIPEMKQFAERLHKLPMDIGTWHGKFGPRLTESMQKAAGAEGYEVIVYTNEVTGAQVNMFIVVGRLLDVSKHRPDRCYPAQGYKAEGDEAVLQTVFSSDRPDRSKIGEFRTALYTKDDQAYKTRIYWSWASEGVWKGPDGEDGLRKEFRRTKPIYKMYVDNPERGENRPGEGPSIELIRVLVPAYNKVLFPPSDSAATGRTATSTATPVSPKS